MDWEPGYSTPAGSDGKVEVADEIFAEMEEALGEDSSTFGLDGVLSAADEGGNLTSNTFTVPKGIDVLFLGRTEPRSNAQYGLITLGGTKLSELKPGDTAGNDFTGDPVIPGGDDPVDPEDDPVVPKTGDSATPILWAALMLVSVLALLGMRKRAKAR